MTNHGHVQPDDISDDHIAAVCDALGFLFPEVEGHERAARRVAAAVINVGLPAVDVDLDPVRSVRAEAPGVIGRARLLLSEGNVAAAREVLDDHAEAVSAAYGINGDHDA